MVETRSEEYVASRIRAGILEQSTVDLLRSTGSANGSTAMATSTEASTCSGRRAAPPRLRRPDRAVGVGLRPDRGPEGPGPARKAAAQQVFYEVADTALYDLASDRPLVTFTDASGAEVELVADAVAGCDGSFGPSRRAVPETVRQSWERVYPYSWLGILADVAPSTDELIYAWHPEGFALHSMRSDKVSRFYVQVPNGTPIEEWPDDRIWERSPPGSATARTAGHSRPAPSPTAACCRCGRSSPPRCATAGCSSPATPRTSSRLPAPRASTSRSPTSRCLRPPLPAGARRLRTRGHLLRHRAAPGWRCTHFSWWMTTMLHASGDPFDAELQMSQLRWVARPRPAPPASPRTTPACPSAFDVVVDEGR